MQDDKKPKKETIEKLRMILDDPNIQDESIKNKYLVKLQRKLIKPTDINIIPSTKDLEQSETVDPLKASVKIYRNEKTPTFLEEKEVVQKVVYKEIEEDLFKNEELYEIEKIEDDIPEFTEIRDENEIKEAVPKDEIIKTEQKSEVLDNLPEWETVESEKTFTEIKKEEKKSLKNIPEWEPITNEQFRDKIPKIKQKKIKKDEDEKESKIELDKTNVFDDIKSIDDKIAEILFNNGYKSIDDLTDISIKDLTKIKGIKRKTAKKIKKDINKYYENQDNPEFESIEDEISDDDFEKRDFTLKKEKKTDYKKQKDGVFRYGEYILYRKEIKLQSDKKRIIHFFSKEKPDDGKMVDLPEGYQVKTNNKTGVPYISRIK